MMKQNFLKKYIEVNAVLEEMDKQRKNILIKFIPQEKEKDEIVISKEIYLEDVPNLNNLIEHLNLYKSLFEKYIKLNKELISYIETKDVVEKEEKRKPKEDVENFIEIEDEGDGESG